VWVRDVAFEPHPRGTRGRRRQPNALQRRRQAEIDRLLAEVRAPRMIVFHCRRLCRFFDIDESRLRVRLHLHEGLDLEAAIAYWSALTAIPASQFGKPYRAVPDPSIRHARHVHSCVTVRYSCGATHRTVMGLVHALLSGAAIPG
jgi:hypothetical protein